MKKYIAALGLILIVTTLTYWQQDKILRIMGQYISPNDTVIHSDAIAVLSGGTPARMLEAIDLVNTNWADKILLTKTPEPKITEIIRDQGLLLQSDPEFLIELVESFDIPKTSVVVLDTVVESTIDEAKVLLEYMRRNNKNSLIVVSSPYHTRRVKYIFNKIFAPHNIKVMVRGTAHEHFSRSRWFKSRRSLRNVIFEYQKYLFYRIFY